MPGEESRPPLEELKEDVVEDLGLADAVRRKGWAQMTTAAAGRVGGQMVRRLVQAGKRVLRRRES
ncbi:Small, acid-soluble spore protein, alpha/beta type [Candidatus Hydrogenisulfobacillus filiaventi]|uniref:Small, acid-soluble spore protein, alpha/beta type n=1 Tax=Candidatus Hydrogenisulfobacillus filiaventi TaxID=2707344 RepID=A0A6F8ZGM1_9FIRM|nr:small, acid-soluble spore protein, alpha/beta type [Bacillota bacterium]CAB1128742.1 Small, acid-soluble spore protein, alpha/beta type [Candidatus Hydrogenisulfobacillus filiaventi]